MQLLRMRQSAGDVAREFLAVVWDGDRPDDSALSAALDGLLYASHAVPYANCAEEDIEPPVTDGPSLYAAVAVRFPEYGMYPVVDQLASFDDDEKMMANAIDDLADITRDLREVVWRDEILGHDDAAWFFRLNYFHWARHARDLALYLHARQFG